MVEKPNSAVNMAVFSKLMLQIFDFDRSVGLWVKMSLLTRKVFLAFKNHAKDGKVKHLRH